MRRWWKRMVVLLALFSVPLMGCEPFSVRVQLAGFGNGSTDGLWLWKQSGESFVRQCRIDISDPFFSGGREVVSYVQSCADGRATGLPWIANVERLPSVPTTVRLEFVYQRSGAPAKHRASAFNAAGESPLSKSTLML